MGLFNAHLSLFILENTVCVTELSINYFTFSELRYLPFSKATCFLFLCVLYVFADLDFSVSHAVIL